tara:strand:- start:306 stop:575 length:270 start_codon:yes stop_codon:yes gene_type:complete
MNNLILNIDEEYGQFIYFGEEGEYIKEKNTKYNDINKINDSYFDDNYYIDRSISDMKYIDNNEEISRFSLIYNFYHIINFICVVFGRKR